ncbi:nitric oxide synthase oxygenase [Streptomyces sp. HUAS ZL42]|uniref:nitric oxide synthase oxygenase n=1 Tax=Streptomyces sp. HUAS ZL42 TaxID=3231715 RepID=UPI00345E534E
MRNFPRRDRVVRRDGAEGPGGWLDRLECDTRTAGRQTAGGPPTAVARVTGLQGRLLTGGPPAAVRHEPPPYGLLRAATEFLTLHHTEEQLGDPARRIAAAHAEIADTGTYRHTRDELVFGARVAWRNANRCIGRLYWRSLHVRDLRDVCDARHVAEASAEHLREATRHGRIRAVITVFAPDEPGRPGPRIWNEQLVRYAGYTGPDGTVTGDPRNAGLTALALRLGWPGGPGTPFDVLPLLVQGAGDDTPGWFHLPDDAVLEVALTHPEYTWWRALGLRWHAVPALSNMCLEIGGICYPAAPFNGWYMGTEIGARNLADTDRYDLLPRIAAHLGLDTRSDRSLWKDRALVELNRSVLHSFDRAGVTVTDHHTESRRFLDHLGREERKGRRVGADWSWIVPPMSASATPVFHRTYETVERHPSYVHHPEARARARGDTGGGPARDDGGLV